MKFAYLVAAASAFNLPSNKVLTNDAKIAGEIVGGIIMGAAKVEGLDNIMDCVSDAEAIYQKSELAVAQFKQHSASSTIEGIKELGDVIDEVADAIKDCKAIRDDLTKIAKMAAVFKSPMSFVYHVGHDIIVDGTQIFDQVADAVVDFKGQNWYKFGQDVGEAASLTLLGKEQLILMNLQANLIAQQQVRPNYVLY